MKPVAVLVATLLALAGAQADGPWSRIKRNMEAGEPIASLASLTDPLAVDATSPTSDAALTVEARPSAVDDGSAETALAVDAQFGWVLRSLRKHKRKLLASKRAKGTTPEARKFRLCVRKSYNYRLIRRTLSFRRGGMFLQTAAGEEDADEAVRRRRAVNKYKSRYSRRQHYIRTAKKFMYKCARHYNIKPVWYPRRKKAAPIRAKELDQTIFKATLPMLQRFVRWYRKQADTNDPRIARKKFLEKNRLLGTPDEGGKGHYMRNGQGPPHWLKEFVVTDPDPIAMSKYRGPTNRALGTGH